MSKININYWNNNILSIVDDMSGKFKNNLSSNVTYEEFLSAAKEQLTKIENNSLDNNLQSFGSQHQIKAPNENTEDYWTMRRKRTEKILEMQQEMFENIQQLKDLSERKAMIKAAQAKAAGEVDTSNPMPVIVGVPAEYLLSGLI